MPFIHPIKDVISVDKRAAAFSRVWISLILFYVIFDFALSMPLLFSDDGILNRKASLFAGGPRSLFYAGGTHAFWYFMFGIMFVLNFCVLIGYKTDFATGLLCFLYQDLIRRFTHISFGCDQVIGYCLMWGAFMGWGARFSVDNWLKRANTDPDTHNNKKLMCNVGTAGHCVTFFFMYMMAGVLKDGSHWRDTSRAVAISLLNDFYAGNWRSRFMVEHMYFLTKFLTDSTIYLEIGGAILMFCPILITPIRSFVLFSYFGLQAGFILTMHLGFFPFMSIGSQLCLTPPGAVDAIYGLFDSKDRKSSKVYYDPSSARARHIAFFLETFVLHPSTEVQASADHFKGKNGAVWGVVDGDKKLVIGNEAVNRVLSLSPLVLIPALASPFVGLANSVGEAVEFVPAAHEQRAIRDPSHFRKSRCHRGFFKMMSIFLLGSYLVLQGFELFDMEAHKAMKSGQGPPKMQNQKKAEDDLLTTLTKKLHQGSIRIGYAAFMMHGWGLFAPEPPMSDYEFIISGNTRGGEVTDLLWNLKELDWETVYEIRPNGTKYTDPHFAHMVPTMRFHALFKQLHEAKNKWMVCEVSNMMCTKWNEDVSAEKRLKTISWEMWVEFNDFSSEEILRELEGREHHYMHYHYCADPTASDQGTDSMGLPHDRIGSRCNLVHKDLVERSAPNHPLDPDYGAPLRLGCPSN